MKEKILQDLKKIDIVDLLKLKEKTDLVDSGSVFDIKIGEDSSTIILDLVPLNLNKEEAKIIEDLIVKKLKKPKSLFKKAQKFNVIFTSNQKIKNSGTKKVDFGQNQEQKSKNPAMPAIPFVKNIIVVASGKGGVGKSTTAVNLALSLKRVGCNVGLVDGDVYGPSIPHMMGLESKPEFKDNLMIPIKKYGISNVSIGSIVDKNQALVWRGPMITKTLNQLIRGVNWGYEDKEIDYLVIDLPPGTGDIHLSMAKQFPISGAVIVSTPQDIAVIDVVKAIDMFQKLDIPILGLIQNMSYLLDEKGNKTYLFGKDKAKDLAKEYKIKFLGDIPIDIKIRESGDDKNPIVNALPSSEVSLSYGRVADNIIDFF